MRLDSGLIVHWNCEIVKGKSFKGCEHMHKSNTSKDHLRASPVLVTAFKNSSVTKKMENLLSRGSTRVLTTEWVVGVEQWTRNRVQKACVKPKNYLLRTVINFRSQIMIIIYYAGMLILNHLASLFCLKFCHQTYFQIIINVSFHR